MANLFLELTYGELLIGNFLGAITFPDDLTVGGDLTVTGSSNIGVDEVVTGTFTVDGIMSIKEITTPIAVTDYGAIYPKADNRLYFQDGAGIEHTLAQTDTNYAEMYWDANATATVVETAGTPILINNATTGSLNNWTFVAGITSGNANAITTFADYNGTVTGSTLITSPTHGLTDEDIISIRGTTNYNGVYEIGYVSTDTFYIIKAYVAEGGTGDWDRGSYLLAGTGAAGKYAMTFELSASVAAADLLKLQTYVNTTACTKCIGERQFANGDQGNLIGGAILTVADNDRLCLAITSDSTTSVTIKYGNYSIHRL